MTFKIANEKEEVDEVDREVGEEYVRKKRPRFSFREMNIPVTSGLISVAFPVGMVYNRKNDAYRTVRDNDVFRCMANWARALAENESGNNTFHCIVPVFVGVDGLEPSTLCL